MKRAALQERALRVVLESAASARQRESLVALLRGPRMFLHADASCGFGKLAAASFRAAGGSDEHREADGAVAVELYIAAARAQDDAADGDLSESDDAHVVLTLATTLLMLAGAHLERTATAALHLMAREGLLFAANDLLMQACAGQLAELQLSGSLEEVSADDALDIVRRKSGSLGGLAAVVGARLAGADDAVAQQLSEFGANFAIYRQLLDDIADCTGNQASDVMLQRPTLPLVYLEHFRSKSGGILPAPQSQAAPILAEEDVRDITSGEMRDSGAVVYTQVTAEMYRNRALGIAREIAQGRHAEPLLALLGVQDHQRGQLQPTPVEGHARSSTG